MFSILSSLSILQIKGNNNCKRPTFVTYVSTKALYLEDSEGLDTATFLCLDISL